MGPEGTDIVLEAHGIGGGQLDQQIQYVVQHTDHHLPNMDCLILLDHQGSSLGSRSGRQFAP